MFSFTHRLLVDSTRPEAIHSIVGFLKCPLPFFAIPPLSPNVIDYTVYQLSQVSEKEAQQKEEKKRRKKAEKAQRKAAIAATKPVNQSEGGGDEGVQKGNKRRRPQVSHVFFDDSDEESGKPTKKLKQEEKALQKSPPQSQEVSSSMLEGEREEDKPVEPVTRESDTSMEVASAPEKPEKRVLMPPPGYKGKLGKTQSLGGGEKVEGGRGEGGKEENTVFVSNLAHAVTEKQLSERFSEVPVCGNYVTSSPDLPRQHTMKLGKAWGHNHAYYVVST